MHGFPVHISTRQDIENLLADVIHHEQAVLLIQVLLDEEYGYDASGTWVVVGGGGLARLGLTRAEAVAMGAVDRVVDEPVFDVLRYQAQAVSQVESERDRLLYSTFTDSQGVTWVVDDRGRKMISDRLLLVMGGMSPASWGWTTASGNGVTMTADTLKTLCAELAVWHDAHYVACRVAVGAIGLEQGRAGIDAIVAGVVWP